MDEYWEELGGGLRVLVSGEHRFGTDAALLSAFAAPRPGDRVCDLCSGCGAVAAPWFLDPARAPARVWAVELNPKAAALLARTAAEGGLPTGRFLPVEADLRALEGILPAGGCDLVTCNPPYVAAGAGRPAGTPDARLARGEEACTLDDVCAAAARLLRFGGRFCVCHRPARLADLLCAMRAHRLEPKRLRLTAARPGAAPWLALAEGRLGGGVSLEVELCFQEAPGPDGKNERREQTQ